MTEEITKPYARARRLLSAVCLISFLFIFSLNTASGFQDKPNDEPIDESRPDIGLIQASELQKDLSSWIVLDARPFDVWSKGHIRGSISFSWEKYTRTDDKGIKYRIFPPGELASRLGELGIDENASVAVYGDADSSWGGEGWAIWALSWLGHKGKIRLLDGGIQAWTKNNFETVQGETQPRKSEVKYGFKTRDSLIVTTEKLKSDGASFTVMDNRSLVEWVKGRIKGAKRIEWTEFYKGPERKPLKPDEYRLLISSNGIDTSKPVVFYCTGGIRSGYAWLVHELSGLPSAMNYEEGMEAWDKQ